MFQKSTLLTWFSRLFSMSGPNCDFLSMPASNPKCPTDVVRKRQRPASNAILRWTLTIAALAGAAYGLFAIVSLVIRVPLFDPKSHPRWVNTTTGSPFSSPSSPPSLRTSAASRRTLDPPRRHHHRPAHRASPTSSNPSFKLSASYPAPMVFPIVTAALVFLHIPFNFGCVVLLLMGAQWYVLFNVIAGAMAIPADLKEVCEAYSSNT